MAGEAVAIATQVAQERPTAPVRLGGGTFAHEMRAAKIVWEREMIRFFQDRARLLVGLLQPVLFLFVLGTGLSSLVSHGTEGLSLRTFLFPGVLAMSTMFTAMFSAASLVWDREFGFLREMLVAPISRSSIVVGKALGGASAATLPGVVMLLFAGAVGVPYDPKLMLTLIVELLLLSFVLTSVGIVVAGRIKQIQSFMALTQVFVLPMLFLSGAMFPLTGLPTWLHVATRINPLTYAVDPLRRAVFQHLDVSPAVAQRLSPGVTWGGHVVPTLLELLVVLAIGGVLLLIGIVEFRHAE